MQNSVAILEISLAFPQESTENQHIIIIASLLLDILERHENIHPLAITHTCLHQHYS